MLFKKVTALLLIAVMSAGVGYAAGKGTTITVFYDTVKKIMINGEDKTPLDVKPFVYNGTTYVPLRYISEQLKTPVSWDEKTGTVYLGVRPVSIEITEKNLMDLPINSTFNSYLYRINNRLEPIYTIDGDARFNYPEAFKMRLMIDPLKLSSTVFDNGIAMKGYDSGSAVYYKLGQEYAVFKGLVGFDSFLNSQGYENYSIRINGDGKLLKEITLTSQKLVENFEVPIVGVDKLSIELSNPNTFEYEPHVNFVNTVLEKHIVK